MHITTAMMIMASAFSLGCSKNNDVHESVPEVNGMDASAETTGPQTADAGLADAGLAAADAGAQAAVEAIVTPEDFEPEAENEITAENLEDKLKALESELGAPE